MKRALAAAALALLPAAAARAQISPGPLSRAHQSLEGARNCRACHATEGMSRDLCLTCHVALGQRIAAGKGLHARTEYRVGCERCHVEHQGVGFDLVFWGKEGRASFDHAQTGFALEGRHATLTCETCHQANRIHDRAGLAKGGVNLKRTFLGLTASCDSCHGDPHQKQFAPRGCPDCHDARAWKPATFDHGRSAFPLTGAHEGVACASCHKPAAPGGPIRFKGTPHQACDSCHADPHAGRMGARCDSCHSTAGWTRIEPGRFDHSRTRFPLTGRHEKVSCDACHRREGRARFAGTPFQTCASCHRDPHAGRLGTACATCHTTAGWERVQSGAFDHDRTRFPLRGRHAAVACDSCHRPGRTRAMAHASCTDCHADRHAGQLSHRADRGRCESCHDVGGWTPARFSAADHAKTKLPLTGAHLAVACDACHREVATATLRDVRPPPGAPARTEQFHFASTACSECHGDPHRGRTAKQGACESCHATETWAAVTFDHARTGFALAGAHATTPCRACHPGTKGELAFVGRPRACEGCHKDPHEGRFGKDCARCHAPTSWKQARFDHDRETSFPLQGAHRSVPCAGCHLKMTDGRSAMRYSGIGKACSDCHGADR